MSNSLPPVPVITFVHAALYTSYALMGGGIGLIILVGYGGGPPSCTARVKILSACRATPVASAASLLAA